MPGIGDYIKAGLEDVKKDPVNLILGLFVAGLAASFTLGILGGSVQAGYQELIRKTRRGEKGAIGDIFSLINKDTILIGLAPFVAIIALSIVVGILVAVTKVAAIGLIAQLGQLVIQLGVMWAIPMYVATRKGFMECLMGSIEFWKKNPVGHLIAAIVFGIVGFAGAIACGIGMLVTLPIATSCLLHYYLDNSGFATAPTGAAPASAPAV